MKTKKDPWTDPDPQPGDFDEEIERATPDQFGTVVIDPDIKLVHLGTEEDLAEYLQRKPAKQRRS